MKFIVLMRSILSISLLAFSSLALANEGHNAPLKQMPWPSDGPFGKFDRRAAQRGFQVYKEVCSVCHSMHQLSYRNLKDLGFSEDEVKAIAASVTVQDGPNDQGEMFDRPGVPSDKFASPYPNEQAARAANNGGMPVDLSLIIKARHDGSNYVHSLLTGYENPPAGFVLTSGLNYNK